MPNYLELSLRGALIPAAWVIGVAFLVLGTTPAQAQTCYEYADNTYSPAPIVCVEKGGSTGLCPCGVDDVCVDGSCWTPCDWPSDCTTIPSDTAQTTLGMHEIWHDCFGSTGGSSPPIGRGQRWYAFHRQYEIAFNLWRAAHGFDHIASVSWCPDILLRSGALVRLGGKCGHGRGCRRHSS